MCLQKLTLGSARQDVAQKDTLGELESSCAHCKNSVRHPGWLGRLQRSAAILLLNLVGLSMVQMWFNILRLSGGGRGVSQRCLRLTADSSSASSEDRGGDASDGWMHCPLEAGCRGYRT
jgi:hypothetical protein